MITGNWGFGDRSVACCSLLEQVMSPHGENGQPLHSSYGFLLAVAVQPAPVA